MKNILIILVGLVVQLFLSKYATFNGIGINILLILTIQMSLIRGSSTGMFFGLFTGLLEDFYVMGILGARAFIRTCAGFFLGTIKGKFSVGNIFFQLFIVFIIFLIHGLFIYLLRVVFSYTHMTIRQIFANAGINSLFAPIVFHIINRRTIAR